MAIKKKNKDSEEDGADPNAWMVTFSDLITLMMTFFVMLLTMSAVDVPSVQGAFGVFNSPIPGDFDLSSLGKKEGYGLTNNPGTAAITSYDGGFMALPFNYNPVSKMITDAEELERMFSKLAQDLERSFSDFSEDEIKKLKEVKVKYLRKGITVYLPNSLLFKDGDAEANALHKTALKLLADWVKESSYFIKIEGHTDNTIEKNMKLSSNWELSANRAVNVMRYFVDDEKIDSKRISAFGYSEFQPLEKNNSIVNREKNRRVEVVFKNPPVG